MITCKYENIIKYHLIAIEKGDTYAMCSLAKYYQYNMKYDEEEIKKYYLMVIEKGNSDAMCDLCEYYNIKKNYDQAIKYYLLVSEKGNPNAMYMLGQYYLGLCYSNYNNFNYEEMKKYYSMAIDNGKIEINNLINYYTYKENIEEIKKYYLIKVEEMIKKDLFYIETRNYHSTKLLYDNDNNNYNDEY